MAVGHAESPRSRSLEDTRLEGTLEGNTLEGKQQVGTKIGTKIVTELCNRGIQLKVLKAEGKSGQIIVFMDPDYRLPHRVSSTAGGKRLEFPELPHTCVSFSPYEMETNRTERDSVLVLPGLRPAIQIR